MSETKTSLSQAESYEAIGEYWDTHDLSAVWEQTEPVEFTVDARAEAVYFAIEPSLSQKLRLVAAQRGVSAGTLLNLWLQERVAQETASS